MKTLKISLIIIVVTAICVRIFFWIQSTTEPGKVKKNGNSFRPQIEQEIESLKAMPDNKLSKDFYIKVALDINYFYKPLPPKYPYGRFGDTQSENDQWKDTFEKNLYSAYAEKFVKQAKIVFRGSQWNPEDLKFIQLEKNELKKSKLLVEGSPVDKDLSTIQTALDKYNEIVTFISSCKDFEYSVIDIAHFPIADVQSKISHADSLLSNRMENEFVNNCTHIRDGLKEIPQALFNKHVGYLDNKINNLLGLYKFSFSQKEYSNLYYIPIKAEIDALDNQIYKAPNFDSEYGRLLQKWNVEFLKACKFKYN